MITKEQIKKHCRRNNFHYSELLFATLDCDYLVEYDNYTIPAGTIVQVRLYSIALADLFVNDKYVTERFLYDAATLLEDE